MTFSIIGRCERTGMMGMAVASSSLCVAARCAFARADVGVCATQNITDPRLGPQCLDLMESGFSPERVLSKFREDPHFEFRQIGIMDASGRALCHSGGHTLGIHSSNTGKNAAALGNLLRKETVTQEIVSAFENSAGLDLGDRLVASMNAGLAAGGEAGPIFSAGMVLVDRQAWPIADLRVDRHDRPLSELAELWQAWRPQMQDYVTRAINPSAAPGFGVPGDTR